MGVYKQNCSHVSCVCDCPLPIDSDLLLQFHTTSSHVDADIKVSDSLHISVVGLKCIVSCEDFVKVNILIEQDVIPLNIGEDRASRESEDGLL